MELWCEKSSLGESSQKRSLRIEMGIAIGISTGDWRGEEDSGAAAVVERVQLQHLQTDLCADIGYGLSDSITAGSLRAVRSPSSGEECRVHMLTSSVQCATATRSAGDTGILRSSDSRSCSRLSVSSLSFNGIQEASHCVQCSPSPSRRRDELVWSRSRTGRQEEHQRSL